VNLFTPAEKILLAKSNINYKNPQKDEMIEHFTLKNLDTQQETEGQNVNTRSQILAPFNSSAIQSDFIDTLEVKPEADIFKFLGKAKEANRKYELDNNCDIDNGIIISKVKKGNNLFTQSIRLQINR
jgi:hypothetical protein